MGGAKMSKSRGNVVVPDEYISRFGADAFRLYLLYLGPYQESGNFIDTGINGPYRFVSQLLRLLDRVNAGGVELPESRELARARHRCIRQVTLDTPELKYNTAIAAMMIFVKRLRQHEGPIPKVAMETLALLLAPYCPHLAEEIWERLGGDYSVHQQKWPVADESLIADEQVVVVVCINGKKRDQLVVAAGTDASELERQALALPRIQQWLDGKLVRRVVVVPDRQVNLVLTG
jgi:leucyl-tRNA synthetase